MSQQMAGVTDGISVGPGRAMLAAGAVILACRSRLC